MNYILQLIGSTIIGGIIILLVLGLNFGILKSSQANLVRSNVQRNVTTVSEIVEADFNLIGYKVPGPNPAYFTSIDSLDITFKADIDNDGNPDFVRYYTSNVKLASTPNPDDIELYRVINGVPSTMGGVTKFRVYTFDGRGNYSTDLQKIRKLRYELFIENPYPTYDDLKDSLAYSGAFISRTIAVKQ